MKRIFAFVLLSLCLSAHSEDIEAQGVQGLTYQTYQGTGASPSRDPLVYPTVRSTGVSANINYPNGASFGSTILGSGYADRVIVKWTGWINIATAGTYTFGGSADDGIHVTVNNTVVIDSWVDSGNGFRTGTPISLTAGAKPITVWYYENGGGQAIVFQWLVNGSWQVVPTTVFATESTYFAPAPSPTAVYSSGITTAQQTRKTSNQSQSTGHNAQIEIAGDDNVVNVQQIGSAGHYVQVDITGNVNSVTVLQTSTTTAIHYLETTITGSNNTANLAQRDTAKTAFVGINGNTNNVSVNQKDSGNHYLNLTVTGNNHTAAVIQEGSGSHAATVSLSGSQPWNFNLNQSGSTNKTYSLPHSMSDGSTVSGTCSAIGGCNLTVNQQ
jgi:hypothetical protein